MFALKPKQLRLLLYSMADRNYIPGVSVCFLSVIAVPNKFVDLASPHDGRSLIKLSTSYLLPIEGVNSINIICQATQCAAV